jgi:hypothetical protein
MHSPSRASSRIRAGRGISAVGFGLLAARTGDPDDALDLLEDASLRANRTSDGALWVVAYALDAYCGLATQRRPEAARRRAADLESHAARTGMNEFLARAHLHRHDLGVAGSLEMARLVAAGVDNPRLQEAIARREAGSASTAGLGGR